MSKSMTKCNIDVKKAIKLAFDFFNKTAFPDKTTNHVLLESIAYDEASSAWEVTIGFNSGRIGSKTTEASPAINVFQKGNTVKETFKRDFRRLIIDANDGKVISMRSC